MKIGKNIVFVFVVGRKFLDIIKALVFFIFRWTKMFLIFPVISITLWYLRICLIENLLCKSVLLRSAVRQNLLLLAKLYGIHAYVENTWMTLGSQITDKTRTPILYVLCHVLKNYRPTFSARDIFPIPMWLEIKIR